MERQFYVKFQFRTAEIQKLGIFLMSSLRFSKYGFLSLLYFCSTFKISSDAFSFKESISFWQVSISSNAFCASES